MPDQGLGIAVRIADGNPVAVRAAVVATLQQLGLLGDPAKTPLASFADASVRNDRGRVVGRLDACFVLSS